MLITPRSVSRRRGAIRETTSLKTADLHGAAARVLYNGIMDNSSDDIRIDVAKRLRAAVIRCYEHYAKLVLHIQIAEKLNETRNERARTKGQ